MNKILYENNGSFSWDAGAGKCTKVKKKSKFKTINKMMRWFKIHRFKLPEIYLYPGEYTDGISIGVSIFPLLEINHEKP